MAQFLQSKAFGHVLAAVTIFFWGMTFISTKVLLVDFTPAEILVIRFVIGYVALAVACPRPLGGTTPKQELTLAVAGLTGICLYYFLENIALTYTYASNTSVIVSTAPFFTAIAASVASRGAKRLTSAFFIGFIVSMVGICMICFGGSEVAFSPVGDLLALGGAFVWAFYSVAIDKAGEWGLPVMQVTRRVFAYGIAFMVPVALASGFHLGLERFADPVNTLNMLFLGLVACALCFATWNYSIKLIGPIASGIYIYLSPVITAVAAALILHEEITPFAVAGIALTLVGLVVSQRGQR